MSTNSSTRGLPKPVLVTGATGYVGGRLVPRLLDRGYRVRCLAREPRKLSGQPWASHPNLEVHRGDAADPDKLITVMHGCGAAYYLIHSMIAAGRQYRDHDKRLAETFAKAAEQAGITRIIYLGGLGETGTGLSEHSASRRKVEEALSSRSVPVTVLRAAMIIGSGSASFEILRYLVDRLPVMVTPRWVRTQCQPIGISNALDYLLACLDEKATIGRRLDIGGADIVTYREIMDLMAELMGLRKRLIIPVPVLTPRLSSLWIHVITPLSHRVARPLAEGLKNRVVCRNDDSQRLMPQDLRTTREAIAGALGELRHHQVETIWSDAGPLPRDPNGSGGKVFMDQRRMRINAPPAKVYRAVCRIGGRRGYYAADWLWRIRGWIDRLLGGPGLRRGRKNPERICYGQALDFWRVTEVSPDRHLQLRSEMKLPGDASLDFEILRQEPRSEVCELIQTARFKPRGLPGLLYWYAVIPLHSIVFSGMLNGIRRAADPHS